MQRLPSSAWLVALSAALLLSGCHDLPAQRLNNDQTHIVYIVRRSWHIDIGFQTSELQPPLRSVQPQFPAARYLEFGFGDRRYLMSRQHGAGTLLSALWPGPGLILLTALDNTPQQAFGAAHVIELHVSGGQSQQIQQFIWRSLTTEQGAVTPIASGPYEGSVFYSAIPSYSALHTCNTWAAESLHSAALPIRSTGVDFAGQLWSQVRQLERAQISGRAN
jgi:uncharacterized protein (TIGR02117 family)